MLSGGMSSRRPRARRHRIRGVPRAMEPNIEERERNNDYGT